MIILTSWRHDNIGRVFKASSPDRTYLVASQPRCGEVQLGTPLQNEELLDDHVILAAEVKMK